MKLEQLNPIRINLSHSMKTIFQDRNISYKWACFIAFVICHSIGFCQDPSYCWFYIHGNEDLNSFLSLEARNTTGVNALKIMGIDSFPTNVPINYSIKAIDLSCNRKLGADKEVFKKLASFKDLKYLDMWRCNVDENNSGLQELKTLIYLNISDCRYVSFPMEVLSLNDLETLILGQQSSCMYYTQAHLAVSSNQIQTIPHGISNLKFLKKLILSNLNLHNDSIFIDDCQGLIELNLDFNNLDYIPKPVFNLKTLESLSLKCNNISSIDTSLYLLKNLRTLNLSHNSILSLDSSINSLSNLSELDINNNPIDYIDFDLLLLFDLTELYLPYTIYPVPKTFYDSLTNLVNVNIPLASFTQLNKLFCKASGIERIDAKIYSLDEFPEFYCIPDSLFSLYITIEDECDITRLNRFFCIQFCRDVKTERITLKKGVNEIDCCNNEKK
jgi:hypothetical protein